MTVPVVMATVRWSHRKAARLTGRHIGAGRQRGSIWPASRTPDTARQWRRRH